MCFPFFATSFAASPSQLAALRSRSACCSSAQAASRVVLVCAVVSCPSLLFGVESSPIASRSAVRESTPTFVLASALRGGEYSPVPSASDSCGWFRPDVVHSPVPFPSGRESPPMASSVSSECESPPVSLVCGPESPPSTTCPGAGSLAAGAGDLGGGAVLAALRPLGVLLSLHSRGCVELRVQLPCRRFRVAPWRQKRAHVRLFLRRASGRW